MKKAVRFELSNNQIFDHFHLHDITREEYMMMWVTPEDFMATKKEYVSIIRLMMKTVGEFLKRMTVVLVALVRCRKSNL